MLAANVTCGQFMGNFSRTRSSTPYYTKNMHTPVKKCAHSKKKTQCISNALAFHDFLWEGGRGNINPFIAGGGKEIDAFDDFFPFSFKTPLFCISVQFSPHNFLSRGGEGREEEEISFLGGMRRACFAWQTVEGSRDCVLAFLHENWGGRGGILLKPTVANHVLSCIQDT